MTDEKENPQTTLTKHLTIPDNIEEYEDKTEVGSREQLDFHNMADFLSSEEGFDMPCFKVWSDIFRLNMISKDRMGRTEDVQAISALKFQEEIHRSGLQPAKDYLKEKQPGA